MPTLVLRFPGGRYHATPGDHHVNEGVVEWPPSPWRILRALIACGYSTQHWDEVPPEGRRLVEALSSTQPEYRLPRAALGHSRHYMPMAKIKNGREEKTLVFDTFADLGDGTVWVRWPTRLDEEAQKLFDVLVSHLSYLGRSESWVLGESISDDAPLPEGGCAFPHSESTKPDSRFEQITLTTPNDPRSYVKWRQDEVAAAIDGLELPSRQRPTKAQQKKIDMIQNTYPIDIVDCLQQDTAWWKAKKWTRAPGTQAALYWREANALEVGPPSSPRISVAQPVEMMLLALTTPSGSKSALPTITRTLPQAELLRAAAVSMLRFDTTPCPELAGRDAAGEPLKRHAHAHYLPIDLDEDGHLDHILVYAPMKLGATAQRALRKIRRTYTKGGIGELQVAVAGAGALSDLRNIGGPLAGAIEKLLGPINGARSWTSATPFVPPLHLKKNGRSTVAGQINAELRMRGLPHAKVEVHQWTAESLALRHFVRRKQRGPQPPIDVGLVVQLHFDTPVDGPICLGYGSHFGLGRFSAK